MSYDLYEFYCGIMLYVETTSLTAYNTMPFLCWALFHGKWAYIAYAA